MIPRDAGRIIGRSSNVSATGLLQSVERGRSSSPQRAVRTTTGIRFTDSWSTGPTDDHSLVIYEDLSDRLSGTWDITATAIFTAEYIGPPPPDPGIPGRLEVTVGGIGDKRPKTNIWGPDVDVNAVTRAPTQTAGSAFVRAAFTMDEPFTEDSIALQLTLIVDAVQVSRGAL